VLAAGLVGCWLAGAASALDPRRAIEEYVRDAWEPEQGLPETSVMAILQTRDGYLWLGTQGGLARVDGVGFALFLKDQHIHALLEDREGTLWIGTRGTTARSGSGGSAAPTMSTGVPVAERTSVAQGIGAPAR
jgi:ligand-binding sensor domain-containing protein